MIKTIYIIWLAVFSYFMGIKRVYDLGQENVSPKE